MYKFRNSYLKTLKNFEISSYKMMEDERRILIKQKDLISSMTEDCRKDNIIYIGNSRISSKSFTKKMDPKMKRTKMLENLKKERKK
jgi:hypothetical protein